MRVRPISCKDMKQFDNLQEDIDTKRRGGWGVREAELFAPSSTFYNFPNAV